MGCKCLMEGPVDDLPIEAALNAVPVTIRGVTLPVAVMAYLMVKPPTTEEEFGQLLAQLQQEPEM